MLIIYWNYEKSIGKAKNFLSPLILNLYMIHIRDEKFSYYHEDKHPHPHPAKRRIRVDVKQQYEVR